MTTTYFTIQSTARPASNLVDLDAFRRSLEPPQPEQLPPVIRLLPAVRPRSSARRARRVTWALDTCASLAVVFMTVIFSLRVLL